MSTKRRCQPCTGFVTVGLEVLGAISTVKSTEVVLASRMQTEHEAEQSRGLLELKVRKSTMSH